MPTDDNADCADLDKSDAQVINEQFLTAQGFFCANEQSQKSSRTAVMLA